MKVVTTETMRDLDRRTIEEHGIPGRVLMDRAGYQVARCVTRISDYRGGTRPVVRCFAGKGNNGGDVFVAACYLHEWGFPVEAYLAAEQGGLKGDALEYYEKASSLPFPLHELPDEESWDRLDLSPAPSWEIAVDGVLGTGISGSARGTAASAIRTINRIGDRFPVISIDVPSGLDSDTGEPGADTVRADITVTMGFPKKGLLACSARENVGSVEVADIGIPSSLTEDLQADVDLVTARDVKRLLGRRLRASHKGNYGHVLMLGGARGYAGSIAMSAMGAVAAGAGLVTIIVPQSIASTVAWLVPEAMVKGVEETDTGSLTMECLKRRGFDLRLYDSILIGPGLTVHDQSRFLVKRLLGMSSVPVVMDADALNVCAGPALNTIRKSSCDVLITPHPGEMGRLLGVSSEEIQADRLGRAVQAVNSTGATVVLKGAGSIVSDRDEINSLNMTGNPGQATGGMGDVLSGMAAVFAAQGYRMYDAGRISVFLHGKAADIAAWRSSEVSVSVRRLLENLPYAFREVREN